MANGLRVVSIRISAIQGSKVGDKIYYYNEQHPKKIADAIMDVDLNDAYNSREFIKVLDKEFCVNMKKLLGEE